ncbi:MAG: hypothetical protein HXY52_05505 [Nitrospirae bacterium]|jgi:hypothetical protein|nr:hypothetical protein [Nitrospirota bacterium]
MMDKNDKRFCILKKGIVLLILGLLSSFVLVSCGGGKEVKKASEESKIAKEAFELAERLRNAYEKKDMKQIEENSTGNGYRELLAVMKKFDKASLTFTPTWVEINEAKVFLSVSWKGIWTINEKESEERGLAVFVFQGKPLKLEQIQRENPFRQPE